jgi:hypothetical protein
VTDSETHHPHLRSVPPEDGVRMTKSFLIEHALAAEGLPAPARLLIVFNLLRILFDESEPDHDCGPNTHFNRLAGCTFMLLAEFSSQFPKEAAEFGIFVGEQGR